MCCNTCVAYTILCDTKVVHIPNNIPAHLGSPMLYHKNCNWDPTQFISKIINQLPVIKI